MAKSRHPKEIARLTFDRIQEAYRALLRAYPNPMPPLVRADWYEEHGWPDVAEWLRASQDRKQHAGGPAR